MMISFNPRSRTGNDYPRTSGPATVLCFNPRSRTGNDPNLSICPPPVLRFNPRSRTGNDNRQELEHLSIALVSIHVPARGTTGQLEVLVWLKWFQSTFPHGERHIF